MHRTLSAVTLADGTTADIVLIQAPDADYRDAVLTLLAHKSDPWQVHLRAALDNRTDDLETRWYLTIMHGTPVANVMTVERNGVGILGHVYTMEQHRQKGLCRAVLTNVMTDFRQRSGKALVLGTGYESVAYRIYEAFGFRSLKGGFMQYLAEPQDRFDAEWFAPADAIVQTARWEHWPLVAMLGARDDGTGFRSAAWGLQDIGNLEAAYCSFMAQVEEGEATGTVAVSDSGAVVACATSTPFRVGAASLAKVWLVDAFAHPLHGFKLTPTVAALPRREGKEIAFVPVADEARVAAFADAGFAREGLLRGLLRTDLLPKDVAIMGRSSDVL